MGMLGASRRSEDSSPVSEMWLQAPTPYPHSEWHSPHHPSKQDRGVHCLKNDLEQNS